MTQAEKVAREHVPTIKTDPHEAWVVCSCGMQSYGTGIRWADWWANHLTPRIQRAIDNATQEFAAEMYQVCGTLNAPANVLDYLSAIASGRPKPVKTLLPFADPGQQAIRKPKVKFWYVLLVVEDRPGNRGDFLTPEGVRNALLKELDISGFNAKIIVAWEKGRKGNHMRLAELRAKVKPASTEDTYNEGGGVA
jgi:hypothetical protein